MERNLYSVVFLLAIFFPSCAARAGQPGIEFIRASCQSTRYPALCEHSLSVYAGTIKRSPRQLAQTALLVAIYRARSCSTTVSRLAATLRNVRSREAGAVKDCVENVGDGVDRLRRSVSEIGRIGKPGSTDFAWHLSNVQTWVSAALTDETTCLDGLAGAKVDAAAKIAIRRQIVALAQETSNALALVNRIAGRR